MALYFQTSVNRNDIFMNDRVYFAYPESEDTIAGPEMIMEVRTNSKKIPIRVRKSYIVVDEKYGSMYTGFWSDMQFEEKMQLFREDLGIMKSYLDRGALVCFFIGNWTDVLYNMERKSPKIMSTIRDETAEIFDMYPPKDIRTL
tara:strand:- start:1415 stop:1846 length:432 start_codon:yes stop_codon:yes gene_type:complete